MENVENGPKVNDSQVKTRFAELLDLMQSTHDVKGNDYASKGRPYENLRAGEEWGVDGWKYAMLRADEKLRRLKNYAQTGSLACEGVYDTLIDIAVLSLIAYILHEEEQSTSTEKDEVMYESSLHNGIGGRCGSSVFSLRNERRNAAYQK